MNPEILQLNNEKEKEIDIYNIYNQFKDEEPFYAGACLAGLDSEESWKIRNYLLEKGGIEGRRGVSQGLAGIDSSDSYKLRLELMPETPESTARGLAGDVSGKAWKIREELENKYLEMPGVAEGLAESLANIDNEKSWILREKLIPKVIYNVFEGLVGVNSERAWELRNKYKNEMPLAVANSLIGLEDNRANKLREELKINKDDGNLALLISRVGSNDDETWKLREELFSKNPFIVGTSLAGLKGEKANGFRNRLLDKISELKEQENPNEEEIKKVRKGLLQGLNSNYIFETLKNNYEIKEENIITLDSLPENLSAQLKSLGWPLEVQGSGRLLEDNKNFEICYPKGDVFYSWAVIIHELGHLKQDELSEDIKQENNESQRNLKKEKDAFSRGIERFEKYSPDILEYLEKEFANYKSKGKLPDFDSFNDLYKDFENVIKINEILGLAEDDNENLKFEKLKDAKISDFFERINRNKVGSIIETEMASAEILRIVKKIIIE